MTLFRSLILSLIISLGISWAALAVANDIHLKSDSNPKRVVELFTSQGCSSCPPANQFAGNMAADADTLVLSYGVTYWDYLGWKDTFAAPEFTLRQKQYAKDFGSGNVYTPQLILNGSAHSSRYSDHDVRSMALPQASEHFSMVNDNGTLKASASGEYPSGLRAVMVEYVSGPQTVPVEAGENRGHVLTLTNVVTDVTPLGPWPQGGRLDTRTQPKDGKSYALLLHDSKSLKLISALRYTH